MKYVYLFSEGNKDMRNLLGGKGANLAEMTKLGLPVPQGFTITTEACTRYYDDGKKISDDITNSDMVNKLVEAGGYKRDNEILAKQVKELLEHNKELSQRIEQLESQPSRSFWDKIWGKR